MAQSDNTFLDQYKRDGFAVIPDFLSDEDINDMKMACKKIIHDMDPKEHSSHVFHLVNDKIQNKDDYFVHSGDKIRFFFEPDAVDEQGNLTVIKELSVNKIGHALALLDPTFKKVTFSDKVKDVCQKLSLQDPRLIQSMYIFKNPGIGQKVSTHQDSSFVDVDPASKLVGFWFALEDATIENGCLYFIPGSQNTPPKGKFIRNPNPTNGNLTTTVGDMLYTNSMEEFVAAPVKNGSLVLIHGNVIHRSERNTSDKSRHAYTFHVVDFKDSVYSQDNWLQPTAELPFPKIYEATV